MIDESRDELRLAGVLERLPGRWRFLDADGTQPGKPSPVDVPASNEDLVLGGRPLGDFVGLSPNDARTTRLEDMSPWVQPLSPERLVIVLLCGGLGTRSGGKVHPLLPVDTPGAPRGRTLLDLQLDRLTRSPLAGATVLLLGSLLNEAAMQEHLAGVPSSRRPRLYVGGLAPRLARKQLPAGPPIVDYDISSRSSYNPTGHLDALRWLVGSGLLADLREKEAIMVASYSNAGRLFTTEALVLAAHAAEYGRQNRRLVCAVEVVARPREKRTGSLLGTWTDAPEELCLLKHHYGRGEPRLPAAGQVLMSANTLYFGLDGFMRMLSRACPPESTLSSQEPLSGLLQRAATGRRAEALAVFDAAFPVGPSLTQKRTVEGGEVIQAERDLDQLSLLPGCSLQAVEVGPERAISLKLSTDIDDPAKRAYLIAES